MARAYWTEWHNYGLHKPKAVFTIHNLEFGQAKIGQAVYHSQIVTTVSPSYAGEISGHGAIRDHVGKLHGVRNGARPPHP